MNLFQKRYEGMYGEYISPSQTPESKIQITEPISKAEKAGEILFWIGVVALTGIAIYCVYKFSQDKDEVTDNYEDEYYEKDEEQNEKIDNYVRRAFKR